jgi:hypothetical protein
MPKKSSNEFGLALNPNRILCFEIHTLPPSIHHHKWKESFGYACKSNNQWKITGDQLPLKTPVEFKRTTLH